MESATERNPFFLISSQARNHHPRPPHLPALHTSFFHIFLFQGSMVSSLSSSFFAALLPLTLPASFTYFRPTSNLSSFRVFCSPFNIASFLSSLQAPFLHLYTIIIMICVYVCTYVRTYVYCNNAVLDWPRCPSLGLVQQGFS